MQRATRLTLALLALSGACAESTGDDDDINALPGDAATTTPLSEAATPVVPVVDAGPGPSLPNNLGQAEASVQQPSVQPEASVQPQPEAGVQPQPEAGVQPSTPDTKCSGMGTGMPGSTANLMLNGRNYTLHIGKNVKPGSPSPLIFSLHGLTMTPASMELMARWDPVADTEGLIIARPAGVGASNGWDLTGTKDFDLMKAIIEDVNAKACVDRKRIYATGFSHGGFMSFAIACKLGDIFAAVAPNAGAGSAARGCGARPVPVYAFHGDADNVVSYSSGKSAVDSWVAHNECTGSPTTFMVANANCQDWNMCSADGEVKLCTIPGLGHSYFRNATAAIWEFFKAHPLP